MQQIYQSFGIVFFVSAIISCVIGSRKGEPISSFFFGLFLGPIGVILAILSTGNKKKCQYCQEFVNKKATVCPHCQKENPIHRKK